jgi:hypothetical protein
MLFPPGEAGIIDDETRPAANKFASDHGYRETFALAAPPHRLNLW